MTTYHVTFKPATEAFLKRAAERLEVSKAWIIRKAVEMGVRQIAREWGIRYGEGEHEEGDRLHPGID